MQCDSCSSLDAEFPAEFIEGVDIREPDTRRVREDARRHATASVELLNLFRRRLDGLVPKEGFKPRQFLARSGERYFDRHLFAGPGFFGAKFFDKRGDPPEPLHPEPRGVESADDLHVRIPCSVSFQTQAHTITVPTIRKFLLPRDTVYIHVYSH